MGSASSMKSLPQSWSVMLRLGPPKNEEKSVKTVLETGLSCCAEWILTYVSEMGDQKLTHNLWSWLHTLSLLSVLICDAKTWSTKKQGEGCEYNFTVLLCWTDLDLRMRDGWLTADPQCGVSLTQKVFLQSWSVMLGLGPTKNKKKSVKVILETGLSCCAEWILTYVSETVDEQLTNNVESASPMKSPCSLDL